MDVDVDAIFEGAILVVDIAPALNQDVNYGSLLIFSFSSAVLFHSCAPFKILCFISAKRVIHWRKFF